MKAAIIPARGGSKRIPRKNIRPFCGKPMIAYSIEAALESGVFDRVIVTTDDEEIAAVARQYGAETPFLRPKALSDDHTGTIPVIAHAIDWLNQHQEKPVAFACCIYATAPFVEAKALKEGFLKISSQPGKRFAFSVTSFAFPIQRGVYLADDKMGVIPVYPEHTQTRSQDLKEAYHDAGQFYWGRAEAFLNQEAIFSPNSIPVILPRYRVQDIDTLEDWTCAEYMYRAMCALDAQSSCG